MLDIFTALGRPILSAIFARNPLQRVLRFLDERSSVYEDLHIMSSYAAGPFLRAIGRWARKWGQ